MKGERGVLNNSARVVRARSPDSESWNLLGAQATWSSRKWFGPRRPLNNTVLPIHYIYRAVAVPARTI
jgi:hypothetical protein